AQFEADVMPPVETTYTFTYQPTFGTAMGQIPPTATSMVISADYSQSAPGVTFDGQPVFRVQKEQNGTKTIIEEKDFAANGISFVSDARFNGPSKRAIQIVGSPTDQYAPLTAQYSLLLDIKTEGGNPFPSYPKKGTTDFLNIQSTY